MVTFSSRTPHGSASVGLCGVQPHPLREQCDFQNDRESINYWLKESYQDYFFHLQVNKNLMYWKKA